MNVIDDEDESDSYELPARRVSSGALVKRHSRVLYNPMAKYDDNVDMEFMNNQVKPNNMYYSTSGVLDLTVSALAKERFDNGESVLCRQLRLLAIEEQWLSFIENNFKDAQIFEHEWSGIVITADKDILYYDEHDEYYDIKLYGSSDFINDIQELLLANFSKFGNYIKWVYSSKGDSIKIPLNVDKIPVQEMYPFLKEETLESYYDRFINSSANILLLIGPPGTGKTTFIRGLLHHSNSSAIVTYNVNILGSDSIFADFIEGDESFMVMEDADTYLEARSDGNNMMHRFLNVADGLVTTKNKKMVFSTNLNSTSDIDEALIRPGRCFDILQFDPLTHDQAKVLADRLGVEIDDDAENLTVAKIFHKHQAKPKEKIIGFRFP